MYASTPAVIDGIETGGTFADRPKNAHHGAKYYAGDIGRALTYDSRRRTWFPDDGKTLYVAAEKYLVDHFQGALLDSIYSTAEGNDAQTLLPAITQAGINGRVDFVTGDAGTGTAADGTALAGPLVWELEEAEIATIVAARLKLAAVTAAALYFGLTDTLPATTLEMPFSLSGATFTSNATDGGGLVFDTAATTDTIRGIGVEDGVDTNQLSTGIAPVADTYVELLMRITPAGVATVWIDGVSIGTFNFGGAVGIDLCPIAIFEARTTTSQTGSLDWLICHQDG